MENKTNRFPLLACAAALSFAAAGCASSRPAAKLTAAPAPEPIAAQPAPSDEEPSLRGKILNKVGDIDTVYFSYDSSELTEPTRATLAKNAEWLKSHPDVRAQVAGHCDQRGTESYNLALGQRRAQKVRSYYMSLGVAGDRLATTSFGKDKPSCLESTEACWSRNRRAESLVSFPQDMSSRRKR